MFLEEVDNKVPGRRFSGQVGEVARVGMVCNGFYLKSIGVQLESVDLVTDYHCHGAESEERGADTAHVDLSSFSVVKSRTCFDPGAEYRP